jgi:hypothetical protein
MNDDALRTIQKGRNTFYISYHYDIGLNQTTFTLGFPDMVQNVKANNCFISVDRLQVYGAGTAPFMSHVSELVVATTIPSAVCFDGGRDNVAKPRMTSYSEVVIFDGQDVINTTETDAPSGGTIYTENLYAKQYTNSNPERKYLCMNPFGNAYTFSMGTTTDRTKVQLNAAERVRAIDVTFKVELIEEEIRR